MDRMQGPWLRSGAILSQSHAMAARLAAGARLMTDLLFPPRCVACDCDLPPSPDGIFLCVDCRRRMAPEPWAYCRKCGAAAASNTAPSSCPLCQRVPLHFDGVVPLGDYDGALREAVLRMKRHGWDSLSAAMGDFYAQRRFADLETIQPDTVVPTPMYWARKILRRTNSPELLAVRIARRLGLRVYPRLLRRRRSTLPQKGLLPDRRFRNVRAAFQLKSGYHLNGARVLLVDDILTTGATASEIAKVLKQGGAAAVWVAVLARAEGDHSK